MCFEPECTLQQNPERRKVRYPHQEISIAKSSVIKQVKTKTPGGLEYNYYFNRLAVLG